MRSVFEGARLHWALALLVLAALAAPVAAVPGIQHGTNGLTSFPQGIFTMDVEDLRMKVQGGFVRSSRSYMGGSWQFNRRWQGLAVLERRGEATGGQRWAVRRNGVLYLSRVGEDQLLQVVDEDRNIVAYGKSILARPDGFVWSDRQGNKIYYDLDGQVTSYADRNDNVVSLERDAFGEIVRVRDTNGLVALEYDYESAERVDPENGETIAYRRPVSVTDHFDRSVTWSYDAAGRLVTAIDPRGHSWTYEYAASGFLSGIVDPVGRRMSISIDAEGRISSWTNADGVGYRFGFATTETALIQTRTDGEGRVTATTYNSLGMPVSEVRGGETMSTTRYVLSDGSDGFASPGIATATAGEITVAGAAASSGAFRSVQSSFALQAPVVTRERVVTNQRGHATRRVMDTFGNVIREVRPDGAERTMEYHPAYDLLVRQVAVDGVTTEWTYDDLGNLTAVREAVGSPAERVMRYEYDVHGNVVELQYEGDGTTAEATYSFTHDAFGNVLTQTDAAFAVQRYTDAEHPAHDALGNAPVMVNARGKTWVSAFDAVGNLTQTIDPIGRQETYTYNLAGDLVSQTAANGGITTYTPNHTGLPVAIEDALGRTTTLAYNDKNQLERITNALGHSSTTAYDPLGRVLSSTDANGNETAFEYAAGLLRKAHFPTFSQELGYDELDRLVDEQEVANGLVPQVRRAEYDTFGNLDTAVDALERRSGAEYDALRQLVKTTDAIGGVTQFTYDDRGNLLSLTDPENRTTSYGYDANDRRISETRPNGAQWN